MQTTVKTPSWHRDPSGVHQYRYWTGDTWTCWVCSDGEVHNDGQATLVDRPSLPTPGHPSPSARDVAEVVGTPTLATPSAEAPPVGRSTDIDGLRAPSFLPTPAAPYIPYKALADLDSFKSADESGEAAFRTMDAADGSTNAGPNAHREVPSFTPGVASGPIPQFTPGVPTERPHHRSRPSSAPAPSEPIGPHIVGAPIEEPQPVTFAPVEASWRRDPSGFYPYRYWNGDAWTSWVSSFSQVMNDNQGVECERPGPPPQAGAFVSATTITRPPWNAPDPDADLAPVAASDRGPMPWEVQPARRKASGPGGVGDSSAASGHSGEKVGRLNRRTYGIGLILQFLLALVTIVITVQRLAQAVTMPQNGTIVTLPDGRTGPFNLVVAFTGEGCGDKVTSTECMSYWRLRGVPEAEFRAATEPIAPQRGAGSIALLCASLLVSITGLLRTRRRLHDIDQTSWLTLLLLIPLVNALFMIALVFIKGTDGWNRYGPPPAKRVSWTGLIAGKSSAA